MEEEHETTPFEEIDFRIDLPPVKSFDDVDANFEIINAYFALMRSETNKHTEITNRSLQKLGQEVESGFDRFGAIVKSILSSQTMVISMCFIFAGLIVLSIKGVFELYVQFMSE